MIFDVDKTRPATVPFTFPAGKTPVSVTLPKNRDLRIFTLATG